VELHHLEAAVIVTTFLAIYLPFRLFAPPRKRADWWDAAG